LATSSAAMCVPCAARAKAVARPWPCAAPVMKATRPLRSGLDGVVKGWSSTPMLPQGIRKRTSGHRFDIEARARSDVVVVHRRAARGAVIRPRDHAIVCLAWCHGAWLVRARLATGVDAVVDRVVIDDA